MKKKVNLIKAIKKVSRIARLSREKVVGRARAKSFGGLPSAKDLRRIAKKDIRKLDGDGA